MKSLKKSIIGIFVVLACLSFCFVYINCDNDSSDDSGDVYCEDYSPCGGVTAKACGNNAGKAWYEYDGENYYCSGSGESVDCSQAALDVYNAACK